MLHYIFKLFTGIACGLTLACSAYAQLPTDDKEMPAATSAQPKAKRPYFNDKKLPDPRDLIEIQKLLQKNKDKARSATVSIKTPSGGSGSGVIISEDGLILTAAHVSSAVNAKLTVIMEDGKKYQARSLGLNSDTDAAMAQIIDKGKFPFVQYEQEKSPMLASTKLGDWVFSIGHSGGFDKVRGSGLRLGRLSRIAEHTIQSGCTLIGGDSGGPLFDINGLLIGIHSRVGKALGVNMHVPLHAFHAHWDDMIKGKYIGKGKFAKKPAKGSAFMGIAVEEINTGLKVIDIDEEAMASLAGIKINDILVKIDGKDTNEKKQLATIMATKMAGEIMELTLMRNGKEIKLTLSLGNR